MGFLFYFTFRIAALCNISGIKKHAELLVLDEKARPIRYENHNSTKYNRYNGNMVSFFIKEKIIIKNEQLVFHHFFKDHHQF